MAQLIVRPGRALNGTACVPGDKSLSHRAVLFAALAEGESRIENFLVSGVTRVMLNALSGLGVAWQLEGDVLRVQGRGLTGLIPPTAALDCGNSATTLRLLAGAVAAAGVPAVLDGSPGLRRRPMGRIVEPLRRLGVPIHAAQDGTAPLVLAGRPAAEPLAAMDETLPVASAQVKSCLLLAALAGRGPTVLREPGPSRDHTERMLASMGASVDSRVIEVDGKTLYETRIQPLERPLRPLQLRLPGDISAAGFLVVAASITPGSLVRIPGVGLNPTRTGLLDALRAMGADIRVENLTEQAGEPAGDLLVRSAPLRAGQVSGPLVVRMIDEFSVFGAAAAYATGDTVVREAAELRYKESDRIRTLCDELRGLGVWAEEAPDGFTIRGGGLRGGTGRSHGDHRLAMALAVAGLAAEGPLRVEDAEILAESFPEFPAVLRALGADLEQAGDWPAPADGGADGD